MTLIKELCARHGRWVGWRAPRGYVTRRCPECPNGCLDITCGHDTCSPRRAPRINRIEGVVDPTMENAVAAVAASDADISRWQREQEASNGS